MSWEALGLVVYFIGIFTCMWLREREFGLSWARKGDPAFEATNFLGRSIQTVEGFYWDGNKSSDTKRARGYRRLELTLFGFLLMWAIFCFFGPLMEVR